MVNWKLNHAVIMKASHTSGHCHKGLELKALLLRTTAPKLEGIMKHCLKMIDIKIIFY